MMQNGSLSSAQAKKTDLFYRFFSLSSHQIFCFTLTWVIFVFKRKRKKTLEKKTPPNFPSHFSFASKLFFCIIVIHTFCFASDFCGFASMRYKQKSSLFASKQKFFCFHFSCFTSESKRGAPYSSLRVTMDFVYIFVSLSIFKCW